MNCTAQLCYVCIQMKSDARVIDNSTAAHRNIIERFNTCMPNLNMPQTQTFIVICNSCLLRLKDLDIFLNKCITNIPLLQNYISSAESSANVDIELTKLNNHEIEFYIQSHELNKDNTFDDINLANCLNEIREMQIFSDDKNDPEYYSFLGFSPEETQIAKKQFMTADNYLSEYAKDFARLIMKKEILEMVCNQVVHVSNKKNHNCPICERCYTVKQNLQKHLRIHTDELFLKCEFCSERFNSFSSLNRHQNVHTNKKSHKCLICNASFARNDNLKQHALIHKGIKPYKCSDCSKYFRQRSNMKRHFYTYHAKKL